MNLQAPANLAFCCVFFFLSLDRAYSSLKLSTTFSSSDNWEKCGVLHVDIWPMLFLSFFFSQSKAESNPSSKLSTLELRFQQWTWLCDHCALLCLLKSFCVLISEFLKDFHSFLWTPLSCWAFFHHCMKENLVELPFYRRISDSVRCALAKKEQVVWYSTMTHD